MAETASLEKLWNGIPPGNQTFDSALLALLPEGVRRYLEHAIAPGTPLANAVRLRMHGEIKLKGWYPFTAEQVIRTDGQMYWGASVKMGGLPVRGYDRLVDGEGAMNWKLFGLLPIVTASGADVTRSAVGRVAGEFLWLPSALCAPNVLWSAPDALRLHARLPLLTETIELDLTTDATGRPETVHLQRWGNPDNTAFRYGDFGGVLEEENTVGGYTIPTRLRIGWGFREGKFSGDGEFIRITVDDATYR